MESQFAGYSHRFCQSFLTTMLNTTCKQWKNSSLLGLDRSSCSHISACQFWIYSSVSTMQVDFQESFWQRFINWLLLLFVGLIVQRSQSFSLRKTLWTSEKCGKKKGFHARNFGLDPNWFTFGRLFLRSLNRRRLILSSFSHHMCKPNMHSS